jgi:hypothetical protein
LKKRLVPVYSVLAIATVLLAVLVPSCGWGSKFDLTMAVSPPGSGTAIDVTGTSPYAWGAIVTIQATPLGSYQFAQWTAPAGTFANPNAATTTFTMPGQNVTATAHFVGPLDHFKCYNVTTTQSVDQQVHLKDEFIELDATASNAAFFCNPTDKVYYGNVTNISNPDHHLTIYWLNHTEYGRFWNVEVKNQFGTHILTVGSPVALAVPTQKVEPGGHEQPMGLDHYMLYEVVSDWFIDDFAYLKDEFGTDPMAGVGEAMFFANPVQKTVGTQATNITHPDDHLLFYKLYFTEASSPGQVQVINQFSTGTAPQMLYLGGPASLLGVPSEEISFGEQLDHFLAYSVTAPPEYVGEEVSLKDQFVDFTTNVTYAFHFCNPAAKRLTESWPPIVHPDYHLTFYGITSSPNMMWSVQVENQFGKQSLTVSGPVGLAVPTQKLVPGDHQPPVDLDHFMLYEVMPGPSVSQSPWVKDEFCLPAGEQVTVGPPVLLAVPVRKTHGTAVIDIKNPLTHLVFYGITGAEIARDWVLTNDQFLSGQNLTLGNSAYMLGVPSVKLSAEGPLPP